LVLHPTVAYLVGENGSGKSTLLEAIAVAAGMNPEGGSSGFTFSTRESHSPLAGSIRLVRGPQRPTTDFFLRAESLFTAASYLVQNQGQTSFRKAFFEPRGLTPRDVTALTTSERGRCGR